MQGHGLALGSACEEDLAAWSLDAQEGCRLKGKERGLQFRRKRTKKVMKNLNFELWTVLLFNPKNTAERFEAGCRVPNKMCAALRSTASSLTNKPIEIQWLADWLCRTLFFWNLPKSPAYFLVSHWVHPVSQPPSCCCDYLVLWQFAMWSGLLKLCCLVLPDTFAVKVHLPPPLSFAPPDLSATHTHTHTH